MTPRQILLSIAGIFLLGGLILGFSPRSIDDGYEGSSNCGSLFVAADATNGQTNFDNGSDLDSDCDSARAGMKPLAFGALGLAGVALIAAFVAPERQLTT